MTEQEQLQILKKFSRDVISNSDMDRFTYESAVHCELIVFDECDEDEMKIADWLQPTPAEIDEIIKKGGGPV